MTRLLALAAVLAGCGGEHPGGGGDLADFAITFEARFGAETFACGKAFAGVGKTSTTFTPSDLRFYVHDVKLVHHVGQEETLELDQDGKWQHQNVALLDFEDRSGTCTTGTADVNAVVKGKAPAGTYQGVHFKLGVPFELNHKDIGSAPSPLNLSTMYWAWNGGYKFARIEGRSTGQPFVQLHLASTGCMGGNNVTGCARPNRADVTVMGVDPATSKVVIDLARLYADTDLDANQQGTPAGCMSDATDGDCSGIFKNLALDFTSGAPDVALTQSVFRAP
jgi:uncharacterized repeat protein (TIGR04052 family)